MIYTPQFAALFIKYKMIVPIYYYGQKYNEL